MEAIFAKYATHYALTYGLDVFPCKERGKLPSTKNGFKDASKDKSKIVEWAANFPYGNIGIATGEASGIFVLDLDGELAEAWVAEQGEMPLTPQVKTSKGRHIYFKMPSNGAIPNSASQLAPNVDVRGTGGYVIAPPSIHPDGSTYQWNEDLKPSKIGFAEAPQWLLDFVIKKPYVAPTIDTAKISKTIDRIALEDKYVNAAVSNEVGALATASKGRRNDQCFKSTAAMANYIGKGGLTTEQVKDLAITGASACGLYQEDPHGCLATIESAIKTGLSKPKDIPEPRTKIETFKHALTLVKDTDPVDNDWTNQLLLTDKGEVKTRSLYNAGIVLSNHPLMRDLVIYNAFTDKVMLTRCPPWEDDGSAFPRQIKDHDGIACAGWLEKPEACGLLIRPHDAYNLLLRAAQLNAIDPAKDWLKSLKWDGVERLSGLFADYAGSAQNKYTQAVSRKFLIGGVRRIMEPGCKNDTMPILEGSQGKGKSSFLRILGTWGDQNYFTDQVDDIGNKDALIQIQGVAIIEFAEMDTLNKSDTDHIKKFLVRQIDRYRPPYGKNLTDRPRRCIFAGTVNPGSNGYLKDPTGGRRFLPVEVGDMDLVSLEEDTPQLWAEAVEAWRSGEKNWIDDPEIINMATEQQALRYEEDPWGTLIDKELAKVNAITIQELMIAIDIPKERRDRRASLRIGAHLRHSKWEMRKDYRPHMYSNPQRRFYAPEGHQYNPAGEPEDV